MASDIREFVEAWPVCQLEKTDHTLAKANSNLQKFQKLSGKKLAWTLL